MSNSERGNHFPSCPLCSLKYLYNFPQKLKLLKDFKKMLLKNHVMTRKLVKLVPPFLTQSDFIDMSFRILLNIFYPLMCDVSKC